MKKEQFTKLLKVAKPNTLPVIDGTGYVKDGRITATDLEVSISMPCTWTGEGVIDIKHLSKIKGLTNVELNRETMVAIASVGHGKTTVPLQNGGEEFPSTVDTPKMLGMVRKDDIMRMKRAVKFCNNDELHPVMSGVYLTNGRICATDAHCLYAPYTISELPEDLAIIIPAKVMNLLNDDAYSLHVEETEKQDTIVYCLRNAEEIITFKTIEGNYPNFDVVIPTVNPLTVMVDTKLFVDTIQQALPYANNSTKKINMLIRDGWMKIQAEDIDFGREFSTVIPCSSAWKFPDPEPVKEGAEIPPTPEIPEVFSIAFCGSFMLKLLAGEKATTMIRMSAENRALLVNQDYLIMPVMMDENYFFPATEIPTETEIPVIRIPATGFQPISFKGIVLADYSERAFVIRGKTKDHKDKLKELNGRFNPYLEGGPGWVFPKVWFDHVVKTLKN